MTTFFVLVASTLGMVLIGYVVLTTLFRALNRPGLLLPWMRKSHVAKLEARAMELLREPLSADDRHVLERALNTLRIPETKSMIGPWSTRDPINDAEDDINTVWQRVHGSNKR